MILLACVTVYRLLMASNVCRAESSTKQNTENMTCSGGTFYSKDHLSCIPCSTCDIYSAKFTECTAISDTVCIKCTELSSQPELNNHPACNQCPPCKAGEYMEKACTNNSRTVCRPCPLGSFNRLSSYQTHCMPCASCVKRVMIQDCTASLDTQCGPCVKGFYWDASRRICYKCGLCLPGQPDIEECKKGQTGKSCSAFVFSRTEYFEVPSKEKEITSTPMRELKSTEIYTNLESLSKFSTRRTNYSATVPIIVTLVLTITSIIIILIIIFLAKKSKLLCWSSKGSNNDDNMLLIHFSSG